MNVVAGLLIATSLSVAPVSAGPVSFSQVSLNGAAGDQFDPHVDGDLAAYTAADAVTQQIHYFRFSTAQDAVISSALPGGAIAADMLSDVQGGRVVFTRIISGDRAAVMMVDTAATNPAPVEIDPVAGSNRMGVSVGSGTIAWADFGLVAGAGEIIAYDLVTGASTRLTNDAINDQNPAVAPNGQAIVWERCAGSIFACDIYQAVRTAAGWTVSPTVTSLTGAQDPDVGNTHVAYSADRLTGTLSDIILKPLSGGVEQPIELAGDQVHPSLSGNLVAFESRVTGAAASDIYLYETTTNRLFQITNTPLLNETLNDVTVLGTGQVRVVWDVNDKPNGVDRSVYGATFSLPPIAPPPPVCANRVASLSASALRRSGASTDGTATFTPAFRFVLPASIPVTSGALGTGVVSLTLTAHGVSTVCTYVTSNRGHHGEADDDDDDDHDGRDDDHVEGGGGRATSSPAFKFKGCSGTGSMMKPGAIAAVDALRLHVTQGPRASKATAVQLNLTEECSTTAAAFSLTRDDAAGLEGVGCSSAPGAGLGPWALLAATVLMARRRQSKKGDR